MSRALVMPMVCLSGLIGLVGLGAPVSRAGEVANPGFESFTGCPTQHSQLALAPPWYSPTDASPDYFHTCGTGTAAVPNNLWGSQLPFEGEAYAGVIAYNSATVEREYLQQPLDTPLVSGAPYQLSFRVSLADNSGFAIDRMGAAFTTGSATQVGHGPLPLSPQVENPANNLLTDTAGWTLISGPFVASANHDHLTIGNFENDANTQIVTASGSNIGSIYYIDGVELEADPCQGVLIDYESLQHLDALQAITTNPYDEDGLKTWGSFPTDLRSFGTLHAWFNGSTAVHADQLILTASDGTPSVPGSAFVLHWMEISEFEPSQPATPISWTGTKSDTSTVNLVVNLDGDGNLGKQRFYFPGFDDVVTVASPPFLAPIMQLDNVCVTLLPEIPTAPTGALAALALLLLCAMALARDGQRRRSELAGRS